MYGQVPAGGGPVNRTAMSPAVPDATPSSANPASRSGTPWAIAFHVACNTAAPSTTTSTSTSPTFSPMAAAARANFTRGRRYGGENSMRLTGPLVQGGTDDDARRDQRVGADRRHGGA